MTPAETFVTRLRRHRQRSRVSLEAIAAETRIHQDALEALEANDLRGWPRGIYARAWIRAYAEAIGLDPTDTVDEFCRVFSLADRRSQATIEEIAAVVATKSSYFDDFRPEADRRAGAVTRKGVTAPWIVGHGAGPLGVVERTWQLLGDVVRGLRARVVSSRPH